MLNEVKRDYYEEIFITSPASDEKAELRCCFSITNEGNEGNEGNEDNDILIRVLYEDLDSVFRFDKDGKQKYDLMNLSRYPKWVQAKIAEVVKIMQCI